MFRSNITSAVLLLSAILAVCGTAHSADDPGRVKPLKGFPKASVTIFPVTHSITGPVDKSPEYRGFADALMREWLEEGPEDANTLGLLLEEKGYDKFEMTDTVFRFPEGKAARKERAGVFGKFVREKMERADLMLSRMRPNIFAY